MPEETIRPVILCGGSGTRLWPLSSDLLPKQLLSLTGSSSLLQATVKRVIRPGFTPPVIVTRDCFAPAIGAQLAAIGANVGKMLVEPAARNTAPAIAGAALSELAEGGDPLLLVMPSDHVILDEEAFADAIRSAVPAALSGEIVTFAIPPRWAETGYGYIEVERDEAGPVRSVIRFTEKPDAATAETYLADGRHYWNGGIFLFSASAMIRELKRHAPLVAKAVEESVQAATAEGELVRLDPERFLASPSISIDYAVLEKSSRVCAVEARMEWSDIGSWEALWEIGEKDESGNVVSGKAIVLDSHGCLIRNETDVPVAVVDSTEMIVVVTPSGSLVVPRAAAQKARLVKEALDGNDGR